MPKSEHIYPLAPLEEIDEDQYIALSESIPEIDYSKLADLEKEDYGTGSFEFSCVGDKCEIVV